MKLRKKALATALAAGLAMGVAGQASASVYAGSQLLLNSLGVVFTNSQGAPITNLGPGYTFNVEDSATLNGALQSWSNTCNSLGAPACNNVAGQPVLGLNAANAPGGTVTRANDNYALYGQGTGTFANSNAEISTAQLVSIFSPTSTKQVAEAELQGGGTGQASTNIQSNTTFTVTFVAQDTFNMFLNLNVTPYAKADVTLVPPNSAGFAQANLEAAFTLNFLDAIVGQTRVKWSPDGSGAVSTCFASLVCSANDGGETLNLTLGVGPGNSSITYAPGATNMSLQVTGLAAGRYSLTLAGLTSVNVAQVPEPGTLMLIGLGLLGLGVMAMRRRRSDGLNMA